MTQRALSPAGQGPAPLTGLGNMETTGHWASVIGRGRWRGRRNKRPDRRFCAGLSKAMCRFTSLYTGKIYITAEKREAATYTGQAKPRLMFMGFFPPPFLPQTTSFSTVALDRSVKSVCVCELGSISCTPWDRVIRVSTVIVCSEVWGSLLFALRISEQCDVV